MSDNDNRELLLNYKAWLHFEHSMVSYELANHDLALSRKIRPYIECNPGADWHFQWSKDGARGPGGWDDAPQPSTRAALVLSTVGCDWRRG